MRIMWVGFKITEKQFEKMKKLGSGHTVKIRPDGFVGLEILGRKVKFSDLVGGTVEKEIK